jgi:phosphatidylserine/phosphatidylglycerophosphate/cardiolipin synthase-like enzyme
MTALNPTTSTAGFGEYEDFSPQNFIAHQTTQKTHVLVVAALIGTVAVGTVVAAAFFPLLIWVAPIALVGLAIAGVRTYLKYRTIQNHFPPSLIAGLNPQDFHARRVGETIQENGSAYVLSDGVDTKHCRLDLIRNAQSSIFLSCYMGKKSFDEVLDAIKERMAQNRNLKVFLLGSGYFHTPKNRERIDALKAAYTDRFFTVFNPEVFQSQHPKSGKHLFSTNHIKLMSIDQGAYSIIGGSAVQPDWSDVTGTEHLKKRKVSLATFQNPVHAEGYRDMDFAFKSSPGGAGTTAFLEGAKLMLRYAHLENPELAQKLKAQFLELMRSPAPATNSPLIDSREHRADNVGMKLFSTGPDHTRNSYLHALIDRVDQARHRIFIGHMYFHPPQSLIDALARAAERGVKIEIITNSTRKHSPHAHRLFTDLAQDKYRQLFERKGDQNVTVYGFNRANTTYHKKVIVIDDRYTAFGSSNLGAKSLEENPADYELNGIVDSATFAQATTSVLQRDKALSEEISPEKAKHPGWGSWTRARFQDLAMTQFL